MSVRKDAKQERKKMEAIEGGKLISNDDEYQDITESVLTDPVQGKSTDVAGIYPAEPSLLILNQVKENISTAASEASRLLPSLLEKVQSSQEVAIQMAANSAKNFIELQSQILACWLPHWEKTAKMFWSNFLSPQRTAELYASFTSGFVNGAVISSSALSNGAFSSMEAYGNSVQKFNDMARACLNLNFLEDKKRKDTYVATKTEISSRETSER
jgi:hypothetical protein